MHAKIARKHKVNFAAIRMIPHLLVQLPAWYYLSTKHKPLNNLKVKCLLQNHNIAKVADLVRMSACLHHPAQHPMHQKNRNCRCQECTDDRSKGCENPHKCAAEALTRLSLIPPKHNPTIQDLLDGLSLTRSWKLQNESARQNNGELILNLTITCKESLAECFWIFTDAERCSTNMIRWYRYSSLIPCCEEITIYMDSACRNNGKKNAWCSSRVWFGYKDSRNKAVQIPGKSQSNQVAEIAAVIIALESVPPYQPIKIITDSKYMIKGLTNYLETWEDNGWIGIKNTNLFKKATHLIRHRSVKTTMKWVKGHNGVQGNKGSDALAKQGANK